MTSDNCVQFIIDCGGPISCERYIYVNYFRNPPPLGEELAEVADWLPKNDLSYARRTKPTTTAIGRGHCPRSKTSARRS